MHCPNRKHRQLCRDAEYERLRLRCGWCHAMDRFFEQNASLLDLREQNFILVKVNFSKENQNRLLLSRFPEIPGYPHLFVLDSEGKLLRSQRTDELEGGKSYSLKRFTAFLTRWAPIQR